MPDSGQSGSDTLVASARVLLYPVCRSPILMILVTVESPLDKCSADVSVMEESLASLSLSEMFVFGVICIEKKNSGYNR